jgi:hypothetical protein
MLHQRPTAPEAVALDPLSRFGVILRESAEREEAARQQAISERRQRESAAAAEAARAAELEAARRRLDRAIGALRRAKADRRGVAEAEHEWREAKARLIEIETGSAPSWWSPPVELDATDAVDATDASDAVDAADAADGPDDGR